VDVLAGSLLDMILGLSDVVLVENFAVEVVYHHALPVVVIVEASPM
jgi:hypothetical protein